jgi:hypothetical protein
MANNGPDHLNDIERKLIDNLRAGTYNTISGGDKTTADAWTKGAGTPPSNGEVTVYGQFPTTSETVYPCIVVEQAANGIETQFMGQRLTSGSSDAIGELYGVAFNLYIGVNRESVIEIGPGGSTEPYKERRLLNYLMLNGANVLNDCDFSSVNAEIVERHFSGFQDIGYNPELETWNAIASVVIVFKNSR